jgi:hypothetical protein
LSVGWLDEAVGLQNGTQLKSSLAPGELIHLKRDRLQGSFGAELTTVPTALGIDVMVIKNHGQQLKPMQRLPRSSVRVCDQIETIEPK